MVDHCLTLTDREERQRCAETIIAVMDRMFPENRGVEDHEQKLWDQLAIMSNFQLDIDFPYDVSDAVKIATKPEPLPYPMQHIPVRHYGAMLFEIFEKLKTMEPSEERDKLRGADCQPDASRPGNLEPWLQRCSQGSFRSGTFYRWQHPA